MFVFWETVLNCNNESSHTTCEEIGLTETFALMLAINHWVLCRILKSVRRSWLIAVTFLSRRWLGHAQKLAKLQVLSLLKELWVYQFPKRDQILSSSVYAASSFGDRKEKSFFLKPHEDCHAKWLLFQMERTSVFTGGYKKSEAL